MKKSYVFNFEDFRESKKEEKVDDKVTNITEPIKEKELSEPKEKDEKTVETEKVMPIDVEDFVIDKNESK